MPIIPTTPNTANTAHKLEALQGYLAALAPQGLCVAFSGGVDSAVLLALACQQSSRAVHAITMHTPFHALSEPEAARRLAEEFGAVHTVLHLEELDPVLLNNPIDRCYLCKKWIFAQMQSHAAAQGLSVVLDGTNADDLGEYRPGLQALAELGIKSPLAELGITKAEVRAMAEELGVSVAKKPSAPCLATRFPYNTPIPLPRLGDIDALERFIRALGCEVVRVRVYGDTLRLEVAVEKMSLLLAKREQVVQKAHAMGFLYVTMDLEGFRSGSMDIPLKENPLLENGTPAQKAAGIA